MDEEDEGIDESLLRGRCGFCAAELPAGAAVCPECGHAVGEGLQVRPRRPLWVNLLAILLLGLVVLGLAAWVVHLARLW